MGFWVEEIPFLQVLRKISFWKVFFFFFVGKKSLFHGFPFSLPTLITNHEKRTVGNPFHLYGNNPNMVGQWALWFYGRDWGSKITHARRMWFTDGCCKPPPSSTTLVRDGKKKERKIYNPPSLGQFVWKYMVIWRHQFQVILFVYIFVIIWFDMVDFAFSISGTMLQILSYIWKCFWNALLAGPSVARVLKHNRKSNQL